MVFREMKPFTIADFIKRARLKVGVELSPAKMTEFLKLKMGLTYHKATTSPLSLNAERRLEEVKGFLGKLLEAYGDGKLVVNLDGSSFSRHLKRSYSWLP